MSAYTLNAYDQALAVEALRRKNDRVSRLKIQDRFPQLRNDQQKALAAMGAEIAAARHLGLEWYFQPAAADRSGDLRPGLQVRHALGHDRGLILRPHEDPTHSFVFVTGRFPEYQIRGWISGTEARVDAYYGTGPRADLPPCWTIPSNALHPIETYSGIKRSNVHHLFGPSPLLRQSQAA